MTSIKIISLPSSRFSYSGKIRTLAASSCPAFFPASVLERENKVWIHYRVEGFRPLKLCRNLNSEEVLLLAKSALRQMGICRDWLWYPESLVLSEDTVWVDVSLNVKFLCIPDNGSCDVRQRFCSLLHGMKKSTDENGVWFLERVQKLAVSSTISVHKLFYEIDQMIAEARSYSLISSI